MSDPRWKTADLERPAGVDSEATGRMLRVSSELAGARLDVFLKLTLRNTSRTRAKLIAKHAAYDTSGNKLRPNQRLKAEQHVVLWRVPMDEMNEALELPVLYEDDDLLVIDKPPYLTVHPTASHYHNTVIMMLQHRRAGQYFSLIHRLDRDTSGVLLVGLSRRADRAFKMLLEGTLQLPAGLDPTVRKTYQAITWGTPPEGLVELPLERDPDNPLRVKMRVAAPGSGLESKTLVTVLARAKGYSLVECKLLTGRQHQIRIHLSAVGAPVVGDKLYGPDERLHARGADGLLTAADLAKLELPRQALHAARYQLLHALELRPLDLRAPLPGDMLEFWRSVGGAPI